MSMVESVDADAASGDTDAESVDAADAAVDDFHQFRWCWLST